MCDSIFITTAQPSPMSTTPAFSLPGATRSRSLSVSNMRSRGLECLYPQCSLQREPNSPSSRWLGSRPSRSTIASYSASERASWSRVCCETVTRRNPCHRVTRRRVELTRRSPVRQFRPSDRRSNARDGASCPARCRVGWLYQLCCEQSRSGWIPR